MWIRGILGVSVLKARLWTVFVLASVCVCVRGWECERTKEMKKSWLWKGIIIILRYKVRGFWFSERALLHSNNSECCSCKRWHSAWFRYCHCSTTPTPTSFRVQVTWSKLAGALFESSLSLSPHRRLGRTITNAWYVHMYKLTMVSTTVIAIAPWAMRQIEKS